ncbi:MAG TPA: TonB-dependent receptor plug domain-containing protein, partial [Spirochaetota bacterium]|nr:TonB-dependent receptor plug domain-containing protein [Spirochaetota bacterium]
MKRLLALLIALSAIISFLPAYAAEPAGQQPQGVTQSTSAFTIGEIVVRDKAVPNIEDASTTTEISGEDIAARSDRSLADSLQMVPGVVVYSTAKGFYGLSMRGFDHQRVAIMIDGIPVIEPYYGGNNIDISAIPVSNVSRIVVNRGVASSLYGALGSVGSINVVTKRPEKLTAAVNVEYGEHQNYSMSAEAGAPIGDFFAWFTASVQHSDGYEISEKLDREERTKWFNKLSSASVYGQTVNNHALSNYLNDTGVWNNTYNKKYLTSGRVGYSIDSNMEVGVSASYYTSEIESNTFKDHTVALFNTDGNTWKTPTTSAYTSDNDSAAFQNRAFYWPEDKRLTVSPYFTGTFGDFKLRFSAFYVKQRNNTEGYFDQDRSTYLTFPFPKYKTSQAQSIYDETAFGFFLMPSYTIASWNTIRFNIHYRVEQHEHYAKAIGTTSPLAIEKGTGELLQNDMSASYVTIAAEDQMNFRTIIGALSLTLGISYDAQDFTDFRYYNKDTGVVEDYALVPEDSSIWGTRDSFNPVLSATLDPIENFLRIRTAFSIKTNFPSLSIYKDLGALIQDNVIADYGVEPERIYNFNAGFELFFLNNSLSFRNDYFFTRIKDKIEKMFDPTVGSSGEELYFNVDGLTVQGLETTL